jgi:tetratricopeptide (TPR) repeat protein
MYGGWRIVALLSLALAGGLRPAPSGAQGANEHIALGDRDNDARRPQSALEHYQQALLAEPKNYEALWKAARTATDLAELTRGRAAQDSLMRDAQKNAEDAVAVRPALAEGHFALARALGRKALSVGTMDRISYSKVIRAEALEALEADSVHAGALHVLGVWNAEIMRVNGFARAFARTFLGAGVFSLASWDEAQRLLERSVQVDPDRIVHHLDLGHIYADRGNKDKAREQFEWIARAPVRETPDPLYKQQAAELMRRL